jgi:hypothetical protein
MKGYGRCAIIFIKAAGTAGDDPTISFKQATAVAGTNSKALALIPIDKKQAATDLTAVGTYTKSTSASPASTTPSRPTPGPTPISPSRPRSSSIDIKAEDLDIDNGFDCISITIADVGTNGQLGCVIASCTIRAT